MFLYQHAALSGASSLGQPVGKLEPGFRADMLELNAGHELLAGKQADAILDSWVFAGDKSMLDSVWVAGRRIIHKGFHPQEDSFRSGFLKATTEIQS
jgi:formimidoylglutamate deiminase